MLTGIENKISQIPGLADYLTTYFGQTPAPTTANFSGYPKQGKKIIKSATKRPSLFERLQSIYGPVAEEVPAVPVPVPQLQAGLGYGDQRQAILAQAMDAMASLPRVNPKMSIDTSKTGKVKK